MTRIFGEETELNARGADINLARPSRTSSSIPNTAGVLADALEGVSKILGSIPKEDPVNRIATSLDKAVRDIEADGTLNQFQKAEKKSRVFNSAVSKAGSTNKGLLQTVFDNSRTKRQVNPQTGSVEFVNIGTGEVTSVSAGTAEGIQVQSMQEHSAVLEEFFPSFSETSSDKLTNQIADNAGPALRSGSMTEVMGKMASVAQRIQRVQDRTELNLTNEETEDIRTFATSQYTKAAGELFDTFTSRIYVDSISEQGGNTPEDVMEMVNAAERDFYSEISSSPVPADIAELRTFTRALKNDLQEFYGFTSIAGSEKAALGRKRDVLKSRNEIHTASFFNKNPDLLVIKELEGVTKVATDMATSISQLQLAARSPGTPPDVKNTLNKIINNNIQLSANITDSFQNAISFTEGSTSELNAIGKDLTTADSRLSLEGSITRLSRTLNNPNATIRLGELDTIRNDVLPEVLDKAVAEGWIKAEKKVQWLREYGGKINEMDATVRGMGKTREQWSEDVKGADESLAKSLGTSISQFLFGKGNIEKAERTDELILKQPGEEPDPVELQGATDE